MKTPAEGETAQDARSARSGLTVPVAALAACVLALAGAGAAAPLRGWPRQAAPPSGCPSPAQKSFGSKEKTEVSIEGKIYFLLQKPENIGLIKLKDFDSSPSQGSIYTDRWDIPERSFTEGFPGVTDRFEWFALDYRGSIYVPVAGAYGFRLESDDGSQLYLDDKMVVDDDGVHGMYSRSGTVDLTEGNHAFRLRYFQGPASYLGLEFYVTPPGGKERIFLLEDFNQKVLDSRRLLGVTENDKEIRVRFGAEVLFDTGKYGLRPEAAAALSELATVMRGQPGHAVEIDGHTDNVGTATSNQALSERRADAVKQWLVETGQIPPGCIATRGLGATRPIAPNATTAGRQKNRRVEVVIQKSAGESK